MKLRVWAILAGVLCAACTSSVTSVHASNASPVEQTPTPRLTSFSGGGVSFQYPAAWTYRQKGFSTFSFTNVLVFLSNDPLSPACRRTTHGGRVCGQSIAIPHLSPGGILVSWS